MGKKGIVSRKGVGAALAVRSSIIIGAGVSPNLGGSRNSSRVAIGPCGCIVISTLSVCSVVPLWGTGPNGPSPWAKTR